MSESTTGSTRQTPPSLIDVNLKPRRSVPTVFLLIILALIGANALGMTGISTDTVDTFIRLSLQVAFIWALGFLMDVASIIRLRKQIRLLLAHQTDSPVARLMESGFAKRNLQGPEKRLGLFARSLAAAARVGETIRNCPPEHATPIEPINVPFEPHPLDEADRLLGEFDDSLGDHPDADLLEPEALERLRAESATRPHSEPKVSKGLGWFLTGLAVLPATAGAMYVFAQGEITWPAIFFCVLVLSGMIVWGQASGLLQRRQWFVVPAGLILREARPLSAKWNLHLFVRRDSVLIVHRVSNDRWTTFVANAKTAKKLTATRSQCDILLRAWLSPLPPPHLEQLSDLT